MCDTLGIRLGTENRAWFGKNSDRSPNEPQILEYIPARKNRDSILHCTYIDIPQVPETHAVLLSRPVWLWGAEMGVNDCGVCIGNEAVWTLGAYNKEGALTGMDLVRLALERSASACEARDTIIALLEEFGQGGNCGFDHGFYYDNSFLIMDLSHLFVLETCGRKWAWKEEERSSISNRLCLGSDADAYSSGPAYSFAGRHTEPLYNLASGSKKRLAATRAMLAENEPDITGALMKVLRSHSCQDPFKTGSVSSVCMHYGGLVGDHTTASLIVELSPGRTLVWATGCSAPCLSLYKPWLFGTELTAPFFTEEEESDAQAYWREREIFSRSFLLRGPDEAYRRELDLIQSRWREQAAASSDEALPALGEKAFEEEKAFTLRVTGTRAGEDLLFNRAATGQRAFIGRWEAKNRLFRLTDPLEK